MGRVSGAHGVKGQLRIGLDADDADTLRDVTRLVLAGERPDAPDSRYEIESLGAGRAAEALRGREVFVAKAELAPLAEGEHYGHELIGCRLEDESGAPLGQVRDIWATGAPDVLIVDGEDGREHLIPAALLREVDPAGGRAVVEVLPGLLDPEEAG